MIMLELIFVICIVLYVALSVGLVILAGKLAKKRGRRRWPWCTVVGLFMYLLVAWEQIPTYVVGRYYCATQAGLTVYKTPEQWVEENPGVAERLAWKDNSPQKSLGNFGSDVYLNERFLWSVRYNALDYLPVNYPVDELVDVGSGAVLARYIGVGTGYRGWYRYSGWKKVKLWVGGVRCRDGFSDFLSLKEGFKKLGRESVQ